MTDEEIKNRVLEEAKAQGMTMSELARLANFSPSRLRVWKTKGGEIGHLGFRRILRALGKTAAWGYGEEAVVQTSLSTQESTITRLLNEALRLSKSGLSSTPTVEDLLDWYHTCHGRIEEAGWLSEYFDVFDAPEAIGGLSPIKIGPKTMAGLAVPDRAPESFNKLFARQPEDFQHEATRTQLMALDGAKLIDRRDVKVGTEDGALRRFVYNRVSLPGTLRGRAVVVNATLPVVST